MKRPLLSLLAIAAAIAFSANALAASSITNIKTTLRALPPSYRGPCPAAVIFRGMFVITGTIDPQHPVQIGYQLMSSDHTAGPISYFMITAPGGYSADVAQSYGAPVQSADASTRFTGWQQLKVWPTSHEGSYGYSFSPMTTYNVNCIPKP